MSNDVLNYNCLQLFKLILGVRRGGPYCWILMSNCNTIAGSPPGEWIFMYFWKNKIRLSKTKIFKFCFLAKKISKNDLK
jgi:hypothetical protein